MRNKMRVVGTLLLFFFVAVMSGVLICGARARNVPALLENQEKFRQFSIAPERMAEVKKTGYERLAKDFLYYEGKLEEKSVRETSYFLFPLFLREEIVAGYRNAFEILLADLACFPVGKVYPLGEAIPAGEENKSDGEIHFEDSWGGERSYGGERRHEGTDLMPSRQKRGYYPVVSVSDGVVEKMGWLKLGGYRVGVRAEHGAYFYYAHLDRYEAELEEGKKVEAGSVLGYMGDSGYGEEGTTGKFPVHLHFGIYLTQEGKEISVNPYGILQYLDQCKIHKTFYQ